MLQALVEENMVLCLHIGGRGTSSSSAPEAPSDHSIVVPTQVTMLTAQDLLFGPTLRKFPDLKIARCRGWHRMDPVLPRPRGPALQSQAWIGNDFGGSFLRGVQEHILACFITDPPA